MWSTFTGDLTQGWGGETQWDCVLDATRLDLKRKPIGREEQRQGEAQTKRRTTGKELKDRQAETERQKEAQRQTDRQREMHIHK